MKNRIELAKYFAQQGFKVGAEIGVAQGFYSEVICQQNPGVKLYCVDYWGHYHKYPVRKEVFTNLYEVARKRLESYNCELIQKFSTDAVKDFKDESLDFVFIDGHHAYSFVKEDIREWSKKVRKGGIVSGHDYYRTNAGNMGVINAVDEYVKEHNYELKLTDWDKQNPHKDSRQPCWYFIKK